MIRQSRQVDARVELSVVVPVYRSEATLEILVSRLLQVLDGLPGSSEIVLVDDASSDNSWSTIRRLSQRHPERITAVQLMRNYGQHNALMCGFRHARGAFVVTMDDDLQHPPEEIPRLLKALEEDDCDVVYGVYGAKRHAAGRNLGSAVVNAFFRIVFRSRATVTAFRALRRELVQSILPYDLNFTYIDGLLAWNTQRIGQVLVEHQPRQTGRSGYSLGKLLTLALNLFTNFSLLPLQIVSMVGFLAAAGGLLTGAWYLAQALFNEIAVPGYASIIVAVLTLGGLQLLALGVMGEYLGRVHLNINRKPQYTVRQVLDARRPPESIPESSAAWPARPEPVATPPEAEADSSP